MSALIAAIVGCLVVGLAGPAGGTFDGDNGRIVFIRFRNDRSDLWSINGAGAGLTQLTDDRRFESAVSWSPDGTRFAYSVGGDTYDTDVIVSRSDGTHRARIVDMRGGNGSAGWSPSGKRLVFYNLRRRRPGELFTVKSDGSELRRLTRTESDDDTGPVWSPDGDRIAFISTRGGGTLDIWTISSSGGDFRRVTRDMTVCRRGCDDRFGGIDRLDYSPNGDRILFSANKGDGGSFVYIVRENGEGLKRLTEGRRPCFSPNGRKIVFEGPFGGIHKMRRDGTHKERLTRGDDDLAPSWGPKPSS